MIRRPKYRNRRTVLDGMTFDSEAECRRYSALLLLQSAGKISCLERQVAFVLAPAVRLPGAKRQTPALRYVADFVYTDGRGLRVVEDVKGGPATQAYRIKRHLLAVQGINITEIRT